VASALFNKKKIKEFKTIPEYVPNVKIGTIDWHQEPDAERDTLLVREYRAIGKLHTYNMVVVADRINNNFDAVYVQENGIIASVNIKLTGFWKGLLDGEFWLFKWIGSLFNHNIGLVVHNAGFAYILGFVLGILIFISLLMVIMGCYMAEWDAIWIRPTLICFGIWIFLSIIFGVINN
jgi:hypothetical protein